MHCKKMKSYKQQRLLEYVLHDNISAFLFHKFLLNSMLLAVSLLLLVKFTRKLEIDSTPIFVLFIYLFISV